MARVAYVDREVQEGEFDSMVSAIQANCNLSDLEGALVAEAAVSTITKGLDYYRMSRQFFENTNEDERVHFLDALFAVADGDGGLVRGDRRNSHDCHCIEVDPQTVYRRQIENPPRTQGELKH